MQETNQGKRISIKKIIGIWVLIAVLIIGCLYAYGKTHILFRYAGEMITYKEAHLYARLLEYQTEEQYGAYLGDKLWSTKIKDEDSGKEITMETSVKNTVIKQLKQIKVLVKHADDYDVKLSDSDKESIDSQVKKFVKSDDGKEILKKTGCEQEDVCVLFEENQLANNVMQAVMDKANVSVSDEEATSVYIYKVVFSTTKEDENGKEIEMSDKEKASQKKLADQALKSIQNGKSIKKIDKTYTSANEEKYIPGKSVLGEKFEKKISSLKKGEVSGVIETESGYVIVKMINPKDKTDLDSNKSLLLAEKQQAAFEKTYAGWTKDADEKWNDSKSVNQLLWKKVVFTYSEKDSAATTTSTETK